MSDYKEQALQHIHICLVSEQVNPNLVPLLDKTMAVDYVILLHTTKTHFEAENLSSVLKNYQIKSELRQLPDAFDIRLLRDYFNDLYDLLLAENNVKLYCNVTGGTKPMSLALFESAYLTETDHSEAYYVDLNNQLSWLIPQDRQSVQLQDRMKLRDFLKARGFDMKTKPTENSSMRSTKSLSEWIARDIKKLRSELTKLNFYASSAEKSPQLRSDEVDHFTPEFNMLIDELCDYGLLNVRKKRLIFSSEDARFYCNGGWLEEYLYHCVRELSAKKNIREYHLSVELDRQGTRNEIDLMVLLNNRVVMFECKTFKTDLSEVVNKSLYKLDALKESIGGRTATSVFVSLNDLNPANKKRAKSDGILVVSGDQLGQLKDKLNEILSK